FCAGSFRPLRLLDGQSVPRLRLDLLNRTPLFLIRRDDCGQNVLGPVLALCRLDSDLRHEADPIEIAKLGDTRLLRGLRNVLRLDPAPRFQDRTQPALGDIRRLYMAVSGAGEHHKHEEFALDVRTFNYGEFAIEALRLAAL